MLLVAQPPAVVIYLDPQGVIELIDLDGDGVVYDPNNISTTAIATDTAGAKLRQASDGSLFIKDGEDAAFAITYADGSPLVVDIDDQLTDALSISLKALAVQKSGDLYKLVVKETVVFESDEDVTYLVGVGLQLD